MNRRQGDVVDRRPSMQRTINQVEQNLESTSTEAELVQAAAMSICHFSRLFGVYRALTLIPCVGRMKMPNAAHRILAGHDILDVARCTATQYTTRYGGSSGA